MRTGSGSGGGAVEAWRRVRDCQPRASLNLLWALEGLVQGVVHNHIVVAEPRKQWARVALERMLAVP